MHLDEETIQRLLDDELDAAVAKRARGHIADCAACSARIDAAAREAQEVDALLTPLDHQPPRIAARDLMVGAGPARWLRRAAAVLLVLAGAGAAYALPGSPLPGWLDAAAERLGLRSADSPTPTAIEPAMAGIDVEPGASLIIDFTGEAGGAVDIAWTDSARVSVRSPAGAAEFADTEGRLTIRRLGDAVHRIEIPRAAPRVEIRADGRLLLLKSGDSITDRAGERQLPLRVPFSPR